jgi:hypothetical protein
MVGIGPPRQAAFFGPTVANGALRTWLDLQLARPVASDPEATFSVGDPFSVGAQDRLPPGQRLRRSLASGKQRVLGALFLTRRIVPAANAPLAQPHSHQHAARKTGLPPVLTRRQQLRGCVRPIFRRDEQYQAR